MFSFNSLVSYVLEIIVDLSKFQDIAFALYLQLIKIVQLDCIAMDVS